MRGITPINPKDIMKLPTEGYSLARAPKYDLAIAQYTASPIFEYKPEVSPQADAYDARFSIVKKQDPADIFPDYTIFRKMPEEKLEQKYKAA